MTQESESHNTSPAETVSDRSTIEQNQNKHNQKQETLRNRLLKVMLPTVLVPLVIASLIGNKITENKAKNQIFETLESESLASSKAIVSFIDDSFEIIDLIAFNPDVVRAMKVGSQSAIEKALTQTSISDLERQFAETKLLTLDEELNSYLEKIVESGQVAEIFLTERHGLNVAYSNPTSDFVQRDEGWWQLSQARGLAIEEPDFDESTNTGVIPFAKAVKDTETGEFLGIIKAAIPISNLSSLIDVELKILHNRFSDFQIVDPDDSFVLYHQESGDSQQDLEEIDHSQELDDDEQLTSIAANIGQSENHQQDSEKIDHSQELDDDEQLTSIPAHSVEEDDDDDDGIESGEVVGGKAIVDVMKILIHIEGHSLSYEVEEEEEEEEEEIEQSFSLQEAEQLIARKSNFSDVSLHNTTIGSEISTIALFKYDGYIYTLSTVPQTDFVSISRIDYDIVAREGLNILIVYGLIAIVLSLCATAIIAILAQQVTKPLTNLSNTTQKVAKGNLDVQTKLEGTLETRTLADNFNNLIHKIKESLESQKTIADEQRQEKEQLEAAIYTLIDEIADATDGNLTVRANLDSMELSTVADLFNAIIGNLQEIAIEAKESTNTVGISLKENEIAIRSLAEQAIAEAEETRNTLLSVEEMSNSIQAVAQNANEAEQIVNDTYNTVLTSTDNMDLTVNSILNLRTTVGETAKKMKRLGESSQKISQAVSFIEEIALKTNILAINATVEAGRAGEYGEGFTIVAEQVATLAEQSAAATKDIAEIVAAIQLETQEVNQAMESGTTQVVETTRLVESTKESLALVLEKSQSIDSLIESISQSTVSQASTSRDVTNLMQKIAQLSEITSQSSQEVAESIGETALVAAKLESTVAQFKVAE